MSSKLPGGSGPGEYIQKNKQTKKKQLCIFCHTQYKQKGDIPTLKC